MNKVYCFFSAQYLPHLGGVERYTYNLARKLIENGNKVIVVTSNLESLATHEIVEGIEIYRFDCLNLLNGRYPILKKNGIYKEIMSHLSRTKIDAVIVNTRFYFHSLVGMKFAYKNNIPCIAIEHGTSHLSVNHKLLDFCGGVFEHCLTKIDYRYCKNYYGVSLACNDWLKHFGINAKGVVYNSINVDEVNDYLKQPFDSYREKYNIPTNGKVITFTGRLIPEKGLPNLLNVMKRINSEMDDVYLFIAGDGPMWDEIQKEKNDRIISLGRIDFEHIVHLLDESDIFCLPSFSEGFSTSILEAIACKCYILTTARGGAKEILMDDTYGTIIENNAEQLLYPALKEVILNTEKRSVGIKKAYNKLCDGFTWDVASKKLEKIFDEEV